METTQAPEPSITSVGWDGRSQPMWRYTEDLHLPDHMRRVVAPEHLPG